MTYCKTPSKLSKDPLIHDEEYNKQNRLSWLIKTLYDAIKRVPRSEHNAARMEMIETLKRRQRD